MQRGEIWQVDLDPVCGSEANKQRPAVIVSNDRANATAARLGRGVVTVVPVTRNTDKVHPFQVSPSIRKRRPSKSDPSRRNVYCAESAKPLLPS
jgi:mRNA-degrading endonuclease toxin of MazEF toxin-antitoxin module